MAVKNNKIINQQSWREGLTPLEEISTIQDFRINKTTYHINLNKAEDRQTLTKIVRMIILIQINH